MKVQELIEELQKLDPERIVILQKDSEGNGYSPLSGVDGDNTAYRAESTWSGEVGLQTLTAELAAKGFSEEDVVEGGEACVVLFPVNR